jgi:hypothetical protein
MELSVTNEQSESIAEASKIRLPFVPLDLVHGAEDVLADSDGPWSGSGFGSADVVGAGGHHTNLRLQLVVRVPEWLVLTHGAASFTKRR